MQGKIILETVVGSTVHGTSVNDGLEDLDLMAVVLEDPEDIIGFSQKDSKVTRTKPTGVRSEAGDVDHMAYGLRKYLGLALKGNPSILIPLFAPAKHVRKISLEGIAMRLLTPDIVSKAAYKPFAGYMDQQHKRLLAQRGANSATRPELVSAFGYDTKYAAHIVRLGFQGRELLMNGSVTLPMPPKELSVVLQVRKGHFSLPEVSGTIALSRLLLDDAFAKSPLPDRPDYAKIESWMIQVYLNHFKGM